MDRVDRKEGGELVVAVMMPIGTDGIDLTKIRRQVTVVESKLCLKISPIPSAPTSKTFLRKGKGQLEYVDSEPWRSCTCYLL